MKSIYPFSLFTLSCVLAHSSVDNKVDPPLSKRDANGSYIPSTAPFVNIFAGLSDTEIQSVGDFLTSQANVTMCVLPVPFRAIADLF